jgi:hypothetical protein
MRLFRFMQPRVVEALSAAVSKVQINFDGWTTKGGKRGFFSIIAHFADAAGVIRDLPIDLPQLQGSHSGERIAVTVKRTLETYGIFPSKNAAHRRLHCGPHTLNLIGQAIIFGKNKEVYNNAAEEHSSEQAFMAQWRRDGPLGVLIDVINYIKTPQQYEIFAGFQRLANQALPTHDRLKILESVKSVVTRWNSFYCSFERAAHLHAAYDSYTSHHIRAIAATDAHAISKENKLLDAPAWMRSDGLSAGDWVMITQYMGALTG